jgi:oligopeptide/dipeptide ABC transporter ATP-binding protein
MTADPALAVSDLRVWVESDQGTITLVEKVDLDVAPGTVYGIVGESGAGKTVATRATVGLLRDQLKVGGRFSVGPIHIDADTGDDTRRLTGEGGVVLQDPATMFDPMLKLGRQLTEAIRHRGIADRKAARRRAVEMLAAVGFPEPEHILPLYPHQLSGGMVQRAAIAMALMTRPPVLVVDEPTSALDASLRKEILELLRSVAHNDGTAIVIVSHDLGVIGQFCDSVAVMYAGRIVEQGPTTLVLGHPAHPYTEALLMTSLTADVTLRTELPVIPGSQPAPGSWPAACVFAPRCPKAEERCRTEAPQTRPATVPQRQVACHFPLEPAT